MKVFVTGGTGFIGSHVVMMLLEEGHEVKVLARNPDKIPKFHELSNLTIVKGDVRDQKIVVDCLQGMDVCIHLALCWGDSARDMLLNDTLQSVTLFEEAGKAGIKHFIYTSSTAAFGDYVDNMTEDMLSDPIDFYCATKAASEKYFIATSYQYNMRCNIIRPGLTFGRPIIEGAPINTWVVGDIVDKAKKNEDIVYMKNDGTQPIPARQITQLYKAVLNCDFNRQIYFGLGIPFTSSEEIAKRAIAKLGSKSKIILTKNTIREEPRMFVLDKIKKDFNLEFEGWSEIDALIDYLIK